MSQVSVGKTGRWWWLLLASFAISLVALTPAVLLEWTLGRTANPQIRFAAATGTVWTGSGRIALAAGVAPIVIPVAWRFDPFSLLHLRLGFFVETNAPALAGATHIGWRFGEVELRDTVIEADARLLSMAHSAGVLLVPTGKVRLQQSADERFSVRPAFNDNETWRVDGLMGLHAEQLVFGGIINAPVGSHELKLRGDGATISISILRSSGPLKLEGAGNIALASPRRFTFSGFATTTADAPAALKHLGPIMADGRQRIEINTTW